jgi:multisubunit Na+/H+ antiporter MnhB subunit
MIPRHLSILLFIIATFLCFFEAAIIRSVFGRIAFGCFGVICICGMFIRWGPLIPTTILAFFVGQMLPEKHGYCHNYWEIVEHDLFDPTILAAVVAVLVGLSDWYSVPQPNAAKPETNF